MKIIAIKDMCAGNAEVGEMWKETKIFEDTATLKDVVAWIGGDTKKNITLSIADGQPQTEIDVKF